MADVPTQKERPSNILIKAETFPQDCEKIPGFDYTDAAAIYSFSSPVNVNFVPRAKKDNSKI